VQRWIPEVRQAVVIVSEASGVRARQTIFN
jgi:hypothetical protein